MFCCPPSSNLYKKVVELSFTRTKIFIFYFLDISNLVFLLSNGRNNYPQTLKSPLLDQNLLCKITSKCEDCAATFTSLKTVIEKMK